MHTTRHCLLTHKRFKIWFNLQEIKLHDGVISKFTGQEVLSQWLNSLWDSNPVAQLG